nr:hypothetical protein [Helicobacter pylori]
MADIFDEFNELKANRSLTQSINGSSYKIIDVLNDKDGDFINCKLFIVKELGVDECLGFYAPTVIGNNNTTLADLLENDEPTIYQYIMKLILQISGVFWIEGLTTLSG